MKAHRNIRTCIIQCHYTNIREGECDPGTYSVEKIKNSGIFDRVVLAAANIPENHFLHDIARQWDVECILGSVDNMVDRMLQVGKETGAGVLARVLLDWFYVDIAIIQGMISLLETENLDYVYLPHDFDIKFGADVHSVHGLEKVAEVLVVDPELKARHQFRPWYYVEENPKKLWKVGEYSEVPEYSNEYFHELQKLIDERCPVAWDYGKNFYYHEYQYALGNIKEGDVVLDIACGWGQGTELLATKCKKAFGIDIVKEYIEAANSRNSRENVEFQVGNATDIDFPDDSIDYAVSVHTMEHIDDDKKFLGEISRVLKSDGRFFIEVPLRMKRPFVYNKLPVMPDHVREYYMQELIEKISEYFEIEEMYGVNRGFYTDISKARNAAAFLCHNSK